MALVSGVGKRGCCRYSTVIEAVDGGYAWKALTSLDCAFYMPMLTIGEGVCSSREDAEDEAHKRIGEYRKVWG